MTSRTTSEGTDRDNNHRPVLLTAGACRYEAYADGVVADIGSEIEQITGHNADSIINRPLADIVHPEDAAALADLYRQALKGQPVQAELRLTTPDGAYVWVRAGFAAGVAADGRNGFGGLLIDIHQLKETQAELAAQKKRYHKIIESIREGYFETSLDGQFTFCNHALLKMAGYQYDELIGKSYTDVTPPRTSRAIQAIFGRVYKDGKNTRASNYEVFHKDGHTLTIEFSASPILADDGSITGFRGIVRDVSEQVKARQTQKRYQAQLNQTQKMEALGTLAGGLAHGFNNVLMAIQGNLSLMRMNLPKDHPMQKHLERINQSTDKGVNLAKQILSFAKMGKFVVMTTNLNKILKSTSRMFVRSKSNLRIHEFYESDLWSADVDRVQIGQLLLSLYMNAADAMPDGGDIYLQSENVILEENQTQAYDAKPGRYIKLSVTDSGIGLDEEARQRIFEPFFSAYRPTRYNGLGLAAVYGTVKSHQGIINVYSEKDHGTTFTIYLPASEKERPLAEQESRFPEGSETVLLVDDDENASRVGRDILERAGYRVLVADGGQEAMDIYKDYVHQIDLVLLDIIMPNIDGAQVYQFIREINANALVVITSGYSVNREINALLSQGCADFVQKPFQALPLASKVRRALDRT